MTDAEAFGDQMRDRPVILNNYDVNIAVYRRELFKHIGADAAGIAVFEQENRLEMRLSDERFEFFGCVNTDKSWRHY